MTARHDNQPHSVTRQRRDVRGKLSRHKAGDAQIDRACKRVIGSLKRRRKAGGKALTSLINRLLPCTTVSPCGSGACRRCFRHASEAMKKAVLFRLTETIDRGHSPVMLTIVLASASAPIGKLCELDLHNVKRR